MELSLYGAIIGMGVVVGLTVASGALEKRNGDGAMVWEAFWWMVVPAVILARAYHVVDQWAFYRLNTELIIQPWLGGMGIMGAIVGGVLGVGAYAVFHSRREEKQAEEVFFAISDVVVIGASLAQAIGRWGNYFNGELYGRETSLPWGIWVEGLPGRYHPLYLYESMADLILFVVLLFVYQSRYQRRGSVFASYLIGYGIIRGVLEGLRIDPWMVGGVEVARGASVVLIIIGVLILRRRWKYFREDDLVEAGLE